MGEFVALPPAIRTVRLPPEDRVGLDNEICHAEPACFSPFDPTDIDTFTFDWSVRRYPGDAFVSAGVVSIPPGILFVGPAFIDGSLVQITVGPFTTVPAIQPITYSLRCMAVFASGRISNYSVPFVVETL